MADTAMPQWASVLIQVGGFVGPIMAFVFGRASKSGADAVKFEAVSKEVSAMRQTLSDTVVTVSNHGQSIRIADSKINELDTKLNQANNGIATLLERTRNM